MEKSAMYMILQKIVIEATECLSTIDKLPILRELMAQEDLARFSEEQAAKEARV